MRGQREREAETQAQGEEGSMQGARCGTRSWDTRITPWAEGRSPTAEPPRRPKGIHFKNHHPVVLRLPCAETSRGSFICSFEETLYLTPRDFSLLNVEGTQKCVSLTSKSSNSESRDQWPHSEKVWFLLPARPQRSSALTAHWNHLETFRSSKLVPGIRPGGF